MTRCFASKEIAAPASQVWKHLASVLAWPEWLPTVTAVEPVHGRTLEPGARFRVVQPGLRPQVWTVTVVEPEHRFVWESHSPGVSLWANHLVRATGADSCIVELEFRFSGPIGRLIGILFGRKAQTYVEIEADRLKHVSEAT